MVVRNYLRISKGKTLNYQCTVAVGNTQKEGNILDDGGDGDQTACQVAAGFVAAGLALAAGSANFLSVRCAGNRHG